MYQNYPFLPPADWHDFPVGSPDDLALAAQWNTNLTGFTSQGINGNPWVTKEAFPVAANYYNPAEGTPAGTPVVVPVAWGIFPGRILGYNPGMPGDTALQLADTGYYTNADTPLKATFPPIIKNPCTGASEDLPFGPYGPRGWQDEYCEWSVQYDPGTNNIRRIDFTCENPEYWNTLWMISPETALAQYQQTLDNPNITLEDLQLKDSNDNVVIDPSTGRPAYNPLNKWNSGPQVQKDNAGNVLSGGAMHLTSTPNTIQTEIGLGASATVQRTCGSGNFNTLICCAQFGQIYRNSDPNIGGSINSLVNEETSPLGSDLLVSLTNPPGLYIQMPTASALSLYAMKGDPTFDFSQCFTIKRGYKATDPNIPQSLAAVNSLAGSPSDFILHLTFEVPQGYTAEDITIDNSAVDGFSKGPLQYGGQIALTFNNHILATGYATDTLSAAVGCAGDANQVYAQPVQLFHENIFNVMASTWISNPVTQEQRLLGNSTMIAPLAKAGGSYPMVLVSSLPDTEAPGLGNTIIGFYNGNVSDNMITTKIISMEQVDYAVPGNTYPSSYTAFHIVVTIAAGAAAGSRGAAFGNAAIMPALLNVVS